MITFKSGALTTDATLSVTDTQAIFQFADYCVQNEQDRIIKLLENPVIMSNWWSQVDKNLGLYGNLKNYVIALIKGEK